MKVYKKFYTVCIICIVVYSIEGLFALNVDAAENCDKAPTYFWKAQFSTGKKDAYENYKTAVELCPGFIRPYELLGNIHRKDNEPESAIEFFIKAAELGTTNYKLYFLLAELLFKKSDIDEANKYLAKSLSIRPDYPKALDLLEKIKRAYDKDGPKIIIFEPATRRGIRITNLYDSLTVRGMAIDKSGVSWIKVNQREVSFDENGNFLKDISIQSGSNKIDIEASDTLGNKSSVSVIIEGKKIDAPAIGKIKSSYNKDALYEKSYAVIIGINKYKNWPVLEFAINDAKAVEQTLKKSGFDHIMTIIDNEATQRRILTELYHNLPQKITPNDRVLFYFAGHGQTETLSNGGKKGYIIPVDAETSNYTSTSISMEQIRSLSSRISAKHIIYVMDSCYSGLGLNRSFGVSPKVSGYLLKVSSMRAVQILTAGGKGEQVQEKGGHGLFTAFFLKALEGEADINGDKVVTGTELGAYLRPSVSNASNQAQTPLYGRLEGEGEFLFFVGK